MDLPLEVILTITVTASLGMSLFILDRWSKRKKTASKAAPEIENEMTVSEFNALIAEREAVARAPLEKRIDELESRLDEPEQVTEGSKSSRDLTR